MKKIITSVALLSIAAGSFNALAASTSSNDFSVRFSLGAAPGIDEMDSSSVDDDGGARLEILAVRRFWDSNNPAIGATIGGGFFIGSHALSEPGLEVDITTFGAMIQGGLVVDLGNGLTLELTPYLGAGSADNETTGYTDGTGPYALYGVKGSAFFLFGENIELGVDLGYEGFTHDQEYSDIGEVTYRGNGARIALVLGVQF